MGSTVARNGVGGMVHVSKTSTEAPHTRPCRLGETGLGKGWNRHRPGQCASRCTGSPGCGAEVAHAGTPAASGAHQQ